MADRWDKYFHGICEAVSKNSACFSHQIGAILVKDKSVVASGYNGPPRGVPHCAERIMLDEYLREAIGQRVEHGETRIADCPRKLLGAKSGEFLELCIATHAEVNCIVNAARLGVVTLGCSLYTNFMVPCRNCMAVLINAGVMEIVVESDERYDEEADFMLDHSGITVRTFG